VTRAISVLRWTKEHVLPASRLIEQGKGWFIQPN